jgi:hypothetical protein
LSVHFACLAPPFHHNTNIVIHTYMHTYPSLRRDEIIYLRKAKVAPDIEALKQEFGSVTSFEQFLDESGWSDPERSYEDFKLVVPEK